ncbi:ABC transporter substrate-binding protein [Pseudonocardia sp. ICBG1142]|uniref:ABC transporter substrate-binding protein n=1 Tax=Pseudonocardia sp. ICBG1142 TaxID=2846760 RepID=UPI001CF70B05|nr:ABC transporter substrate-binding protein [Pseudonocardia sp. ICBG1142]
MRIPWSVLVLAGLVALSGCAPGVTGTSDPAGPAGAAFPVTVPHGQGEAVVPAPPQRVVVLGAGDAQIASALGAPVVGAVRNPAAPDGSWRGVDPPLPAGVSTLDPLAPDLEAVAALRPDLILMTTAQPGYAAAYPRLATIAPTVSYRHALLQDAGEDLTRMIGAALGRADAAEALIARSDAALARFRAELGPDRRYVFGQYAAGTTYLVTAPDGPSVRFFERIGLTVPPAVAALPPWQAGIAQLPDEQLGLLDDADVVLIGVPTDGEGREFTTRPLVARGPLVREGRLHLLSVADSALLLTPNPASTPALIETLRPLLETS